MRVYLPAEEQDAPVVVCTELPTNEGSSITHAAERLAAEVIRYHRLPAPIVWIEHHPPITADGDTKTFDLVDFSGYEVRERGPYLGETRLTVGEATWKRITRGMVEVLVGGEV
jgi:ABC-type microcin C transport system permease subunit YejE